MSLRIVHLASDIEGDDDFHVARLLILMHAVSGKGNRPIEGIMKLAKLDFLLRYPNCLVRVLEKLGKAEAADAIGNEERNTIEARMIRFRYEPWDSRYRRWIGVLVAKSLANTYLEGRTVRVQLTSEGAALADTLGELPEFSVLKKRSDLIKASVGAFSGSKLKDFIYEVFPEILDMSWGHRIEL